MTVEGSTAYQTAVRDFRQARRRAALHRLFARLSGRSVELFDYDELLDAVDAGLHEGRGVQTIPLDAIVGSVNRYHDFTRSFLPTKDSNEARWARVRMMMTSGQPMDPIEVYQIGEAYFVIDGNHRVSVSREMGLKTIQAHVTEIETPVPLTLNDDVNDFVCKARLANFLKRTRLDITNPDIQFRLTACTKFDTLLGQIERYQGYMEEAAGAPVSLPEAASAWCETVYEPTLEIIARQGILRDFPDRTEADLFVWLLEHQQDLKEFSGWSLSPGEAAHDLATRHAPQKGGFWQRVTDFVRSKILTESVTGGPDPGEWRRERVGKRDDKRLFAEIFLLISYIDLGEDALRLALLISQREGSDLYTSYEVREEADLTRPEVVQFGEQVTLKTKQAGVAVNYTAEVVVGLEVVRERSRWVDIVVAEITYPPGNDIRARLSSHFHQMLQRCPRPVLAVPPRTDSTLSKAVLPYDGSSKSREALFVATYLVQRWPIELVVLSVNEGDGQPVLDDAQEYLQHAARDKVTYVSRTGEVAKTILAVALEKGCDFIVMGGFSHRPVLQLMLGSSVEEVLADGRFPVLVCR